MSVRERRVRDNPPYPEAKDKEAELKGGSIGRPDDWLGIYDRSIKPGFRFPLERI
jgi:hypothetical protein